MKCYHHNDADGRCSAAVVNLAMNGEKLEFIELDYAKDIDVDAIEVGEHVLVVDFSFKPDLMRKVRARAGKVTWIDHHKTAENYDYANELDGKLDFSEPGKSAAYLAWEYFFKEEPVPWAIKLVDDYDTWKHKIMGDKEFNLGLMLNEWAAQPKDDAWNHLFRSDEFVQGIIKDGVVAMKFRDAKCLDYCRSYGYETEIGGHKAFTVNLYTFGSHTFGKRMKQYPICAGYVFDGRVFTVSLYSDMGIDTSVISKGYGGGGHSAASGFQCKELPFKRNVC